MVQSKVTLTEELANFISLHKKLGFKDKSAMVRNALARMKTILEKEQLEKSASLYAELYKNDKETQEWVQDSTEDWIKNV